MQRHRKPIVMQLEDWMIPRFDETLRPLHNNQSFGLRPTLSQRRLTTASTRSRESVTEESVIDVNVTDCSLWKSRRYTTASQKDVDNTRRRTNESFVPSGRDNDRLSQNLSRRTTTATRSRESVKENSVIDVNVTDCSLWKSRRDTINSEKNMGRKSNIGMDITKKRETFGLNVTDGSLWRTKVHDNTQESVKTVYNSELLALVSANIPQNVMDSFNLEISDNSLWRTKLEINDTTETNVIAHSPAFEPSSDLGDGMGSFEHDIEALENTLVEMGHDEVFADVVWLPPDENEAELSNSLRKLTVNVDKEVKDKIEPQTALDEDEKFKEYMREVSLHNQSVHETIVEEPEPLLTNEEANKENEMGKDILQVFSECLIKETPTILSEKSVDHTLNMSTELDSIEEEDETIEEMADEMSRSLRIDEESQGDNDTEENIAVPSPKPIIKRPLPKNPLLQKFASKSPVRSRQSLMPLDPRRPSMPRMSLGLPMFRNLNLKRKSSLNSESSGGSSPQTSSARSSMTPEPSTPKSPAKKIINLSKKSSPRLVDRVRMREMIKAAKERSYASPTISSMSKMASHIFSPSVCNKSGELVDSPASTPRSSRPGTPMMKSRWDTPKSSKLNCKGGDEGVFSNEEGTQVTKKGVKRCRNHEGRSSALDMIAKIYQTPVRDEPKGPLESMMSEEGDLLSGPIPSQPPQLNYNINPRILFEGNDTPVNAEDLLSQPLQSQKNAALHFLNDSDITLGSESPLRQEEVRLPSGNLPNESRFLSDTIIGPAIDDLPSTSSDIDFDSTKIMSFAKDSDDTGVAYELDNEDDGLNSPAPKHLIIAAKKQKRLQEAKIKLPKLVVGADEFASDHNLRRSTRTRPTRRLNHGAGEHLVYSPGGSVIGVEQGKIHHPLCIKYKTTDLAKALEMDKRSKKTRAELRKVQRFEREQRLAQLE